MREKMSVWLHTYMHYLRRNLSQFSSARFMNFDNKKQHEPLLNSP